MFPEGVKGGCEWALPRIRERVFRPPRVGLPVEIFYALRTSTQGREYPTAAPEKSLPWIRTGFAAAVAVPVAFSFPPRCGHRVTSPFRPPLLRTIYAAAAAVRRLRLRFGCSSLFSARC